MWNLDFYFVTRGLSFGTLLFRIFPYKVSVPVFLSFPPAVLVPCLGLAIGSWLVARLHRPYQAAVTLVNAALVLAAGMVTFVIKVVRTFRYIENHPRVLYGPHYFWFYVVVSFWAFELVLYVVSTLAAGLWNRPSPAADSV
jgi:hypothetical protein